MPAVTRYFMNLMNFTRARWMLAIGLWSCAVTGGLFGMMAYDAQPGRATVVPTAWPGDDASLALDRSRPTLVLFVHPRCPCTRATIDELSRLMAHCQERLTVRVAVVRPPGAPDGFERTDLPESILAIPGVQVIVDADGNGARRFGALTSGHAMLFDVNGALRFTGGITAGRGHRGDNAGTSAIRATVLRDQSTDAAPIDTPVYGCPLFSPVTPTTNERPCDDPTLCSR